MFYHIVGKLFKDMVVPVLAHLCKIAAYDRVSESKELGLTSVSLYGDYKVSKTVTVILSNYSIELVTVHKGC